jgi:hypothetical protein
MRRIKRLLLVAALIATSVMATTASGASASMPVVVPPPPPDANVALGTTAAGGAVFQGTASLPRFPCPPPPPFGTGPCAGSFSGQWTGQLAGTSNTSPFEVTWSTGSTINANFNYYELQCLGGVETLLGVAGGSGTATAGPGSVDGNWLIPGELFPRDVIGVSATFTFTWARVGNAAVLNLDTASLQLNVSGIGWTTVISKPQTATATFAPTQSTGTGVPSCSNPLTNVSGIIAGDLPLHS